MRKAVVLSQNVVVKCISPENDFYLGKNISNFTPVERILYSLIEAENAIFPFRSRAGMRHFRPGVRKKYVLQTKMSLSKWLERRDVIKNALMISRPQRGKTWPVLL